LSVEAKILLSISHNQSGGLAAEEGLCLGNQFNTGSKGTTTGDVFTARVQGLNIKVGGNEFGTLVDKRNSLAELLIVIRRTFTENNVVRVDIVHEKSLFIKCKGKPRLANDIDGSTFGHLGREEFSSSQSSSIELVFVNINTQATELLLQFTRSRSRVVCQEQELLVVVKQKLYKFLSTRK
jgi:hypothetical protein